MEKARRKLRICLLFVVALAVAAGICYYCFAGEEVKINEGTLVMHSVTRDEKRAQKDGVETIKEMERVQVCRL